MIIFKKLTLKNFMSFKDDEFIFENGKPIALQGENLTDDGQKSNGSGKSVLLEAVYRAIVGTSIRKGIKDKELIRNDEPEAIISLLIHDSQIKDDILITRTINQKKSEVLEIVVGDENQKDKFATVKDGNRFLLDEILNITREDIDNAYLINSEKYVSFFFSPDSAKKELIGRFSGADAVLGIDEEIESEISDLEAEKGELEKSKDGLLSKIELLEEQVEGFSLETEKEKKQKAIDEINNLINKCEIEIKENSSKIAQRKKEIAEHNKNISLFRSELENVNIDDEEEAVKGIEKEISESKGVCGDLEKKKKEVKERIENHLNKAAILRNKIRGKVVCPKCDHEFVPDDEETDVLKVQKELGKNKLDADILEVEIETIDKDIEEVDSITEQLNKERGELQKKVDEVQSIVREINNDIQGFEDSVNYASKEIEALDKDNKLNESSIERYKAQIKEINSETINDPRKALKEQISAFKVEISALEEGIQQKEDEIFETKQYIFDFKQFFTYLTNKSLKVIEVRTNEYLKAMRSDLSIRIDGVKMLSNGKLKENITPTIFRDGLMEGSFGKLSGGERVRVDAANLIARQSIINETHPKQGLDIIWVDEQFDKVDSLGMDNLLESCKPLNKTMILTTHISTDLNHDTVKVVKENGVSKVWKN